MKKSKKKLKVEEIKVCPECGSRHLHMDYERGELICEDCGLVIDDTFIDEGPEWRSFDSEDAKKKERTGAPMNYAMHDKGLSTEISWKNTDSYGKQIPSKNRAQMYRLRRWQKRIRISNAAERNLAYALGELERISASMGLPRNVRENAAALYRKAVDESLIRGRSVEAVVAATIYASCRQLNVPRTLDEIAAATRVGKKDIGRTYRFLSSSLKLRLLPTRPQDYVSRFCSELKLSGRVQMEAMRILDEAERKELSSGRGPTGVAAAAIYIASILQNERRTQREVADVAGVTEVTIRNRYKELVENLEIDVEI